MAVVILVTATSFMRNESLREELERRLPPSATVHYLDLRQTSCHAFFQNPEWTAAVSGWLVGGEPVDAETLKRFDSLRVISKYGVGVDNIDFEACAARLITVHVEYGVNSLAVAEHTLGLILGLCRRIHANSRFLAQGLWNKDGGEGLQGLRIGIVGLGAVGSHLAHILRYFGATLAYCDIEARPGLEKSLEIHRLNYADIISWADLLSFHVPLTDQTRKMFGAAEISRTRRGVVVINTSRGMIVDQEALKHGLASGQIAGAGLDVFEIEPLRDKQLTEFDGFLGTPHTAGNSRQAVEAMGQAAIRGLTEELHKAKP